MTQYGIEQHTYGTVHSIALLTSHVATPQTPLVHTHTHTAILTFPTALSAFLEAAALALLCSK
jgi:hypothetical protein